MPKTYKTFIGACGVLAVLAALTAISRTEAFAQLRATLVRSVDEPARTPYDYAVLPSRPLGNVYYADFPAVPSGRRLRATRISGIIRFVSSSNSGAFLSLHQPGASTPLIAFPLTSFVAAYYGRVYSFNFDVDTLYEAGQQPRVEIGVSSGTGNLPFPNSGEQVIRLSGYLVDLSL